MDQNTPHGDPDENEETPPPGTPRPGQVMGLGGLLRAWRTTAGTRLGNTLTQQDVAEAVGRSERWYRNLENGATAKPLDRKQCEALADVLDLGRDERHALLLHNNGGSLDVRSQELGPRARSALRLLIDKQMPSPAYLCDSNWNILGYNQTMAEWFPWVMEPGANLMRWALTTPEARQTYHDWGQHAVAFTSLLKFALAGRGNNPELPQLIADVCKDPEVRHIWETYNELVENRDGDVYRMSFAALDWEPVDLVSHVLHPASLPDCRLVVITWLQEEDERDILESAAPTEAESVGQKCRGSKSPAHPRLLAHALTGRLFVPTAQQAAALAGDDGLALPVISQMIGPNCQLTLSPRTQTVIWATKEDDDRWGVAEVDAYTVIVRVPQAAPLPAAYHEVKALTRAVLPAEPADAVDRIQILISQLKARISLLEEIHRDLWETDNSLPHAWHPVDKL
ncbi:helix-turn-helix transcriptional regulator [Streptomyces albipurpureus]|uniref:Helix-turn-helix transcriptional regulator n=1 Tax=Streptomyces albipurpureus TaxID=2897419 RepID=A0ABT0UWL8_9ACTN|nr:helix-turn-helix transcriptional regulator [Streptomyces sp. CWNU-1]MCM2392035.1 helix-turn-helix transcriptional regulator [Streptomyces sp. CWNU-1]